MTHKYNGLIRPHQNKLLSLYRVFDAFIVFATLWYLSQWLEYPWDSEQSKWIIFTIVLFYLFAELCDVYVYKRGESLIRIFFKIPTAWFFVISCLLIINQIYPLITSTKLFFYWASIVPIELISWHMIIKVIVDNLRAAGRNSRKAAIVGVNALGKEIETILIKDAALGIKFCGYYDSRAPTKNNTRITIDQSQYCGNYNQLIKDAQNGLIDIVYITLPMKAEQRIKEIADALADSTLSVFYVPDLFVFDLLRSQWQSFHGIPIVSIYDTPYYGIDGIIKRIFDIIVSSIILMIIAIPMLIIAAAIKIDSSGPILFKQRRYGFKGEEVVIWKFRSMTVCEDGDQVQQARKADPRLTRLGGILRHTSLDEFPQFINVLQGRMSVVGPRPHAIAHNELYRGQIKGYMLRHKVRPGITGWAQINGFRGETDTIEKMEGRIKYDLDYIRNWSIGLDIKIIFLTIFKGFTNPNAY